jgi:CPA1 family monovalent cation:H+ antiporter
MSEIEALLLLMTAATLLVAVARVIGIPYPILLVLGGLAIGFLPGIPTISLDPDYVFILILPPILQSAAFLTPVRDLRAQARPVLSLAVGLVLLSTCVVAIGAHWIVGGLSWPSAFVLGAVVSPPDAVAATSVAERLHLPDRVVRILEGESLLNDATALVTYRVAVTAAVSGTFSLPHALGEFALAAAGGLLVGLLAGWLVVQLLLRTSDGSVLIAISLLAPYGTYLLAEHLEASGVLAVVIEGLIMGRGYFRLPSARTRLQSLDFWDMFIFLLNGFVFILIGVQLPDVIDGVSEQSRATLTLYAIAISLTAVAVRIAWVVVTSDPRALRRQGLSCSNEADRRELIVISWAGMRGVVSLAAALALPGDVPGRDLIIFLTFAVILATLVGQGLTLAPLIQRLGLGAAAGANREEISARVATTRAGRTRLDQLAREEWAIQDVVADLTDHLEQRARRLRSWNDADASLDDVSVAFQRLQIELIEAEMAEAFRLRDSGRINDTTLRKIQRELDIERIRLDRL